MSRVEVIVERRGFTRREERFSDWSVGYVRKMFVVNHELYMHHYTDVVSVVSSGDVFRVFDKYWREARRVKEVLGADVVLGICSRDECIDLSDDYSFKLVTSKYRLKRLMWVWRTLKKLVGDDVNRKISMMSGDGIVALSVGGCVVDLYLDEAVALSGLLLMYLHTVMRYEVLWNLYREVSKAFDVSEIGLEVDVERVERGCSVVLDVCRVFLTNEEVLLLAYRLLDAALWQIETE
ncbi:MAG: hypothetical protein ACO2O1_06690 [Candidatus Caldarchaeales archaeon]|jgi:DNA-binding ferritin-like protein (Dps family)